MGRQGAIGFLSALMLGACVARAQVCTFDGPQDLTGWKVKAGAVLDDSQRYGTTGSSLKLPPESSAVMTFREKDGAGTVTMWVYDDCTKPSDPKERRAGPRWGLVSADGRALVVGAIYAPYLSGDQTYASSEFGGKGWFSSIQYLAVRREPKWRKWVFAFDPDKGLSISVDDKPVTRFDWNKTKFAGFNGIALYGDSVADQSSQTLWVDSIQIAQAGEVTAKPTAPPPPPPVVPETDPKVEGPVPKLLPAVKDVHPRLLFSPSDISRMKEFYASEEGRFFRERIEQYARASNPPDTPGWASNDTEAQRQGLWRTPTVALRYLMTGDKGSLEKTVGYLKAFLAQNQWQTGQEVNSGMGAANILAGAALGFDMVYSDLDPSFREEFRKKLFQMAREMYYRGHLQKTPGSVGYWQSDPQNNHRWHRDAGLTLAVLASYSGAPEEDWLLTQTLEELKFVAKWLPQEGCHHESGSYLIFGLGHLILAMSAADNCLGTDFLKQPFFQNVGEFRLQSLVPGFSELFHYGDSAGRGGTYASFVYKPVAVNRKADQQAGLDLMRQKYPDDYDFGWMGFVSYDPTLKGGSIENLRKAAFYEDLGIAFIRDGWEEKNVGAMFKCGPLGGYTLNRYRNENNFKYINVAHDDPDANSFIIFARGAILAEADRYSSHKKSAQFNTILVNGVGQVAQGRQEGLQWSQPATGRTDMTKMAYITAWKDGGDFVAIEGEAAGSYPALAGRRPALERFRRTFLWLKDRYILVLDDIRAPSEVEIAWLMQGEKLTEIDPSAMRYRLAKKDVSCDFQIASEKPLSTTIGTSEADSHGTLLNWQQLRATAKTSHLRVASVYAAWGGDVKVSLEVKPDGKSAAVTVVSPKGTDVWQWVFAPDSETPSAITGALAGRQPAGISVADKPKGAGR